MRKVSVHGLAALILLGGILSARSLSATDSPEVPLDVGDSSTRGTDEIRFLRDETFVVVRVGQIDFARYVFRDPQISRPFFAHVRALNGVQVTRNHPPRAGDKKDHAKLHPGIWFACGDINGQDFWRLRAPYRFLGFAVEPSVKAGTGRFAARFELCSSDREGSIGEVVEHYEILPRDGGVLLDARYEFLAKDRRLVFGDQEEMGLGIRVATELAVSTKGGGRILDAHGRRDGKGVWGKSAPWCDYAGPLGGGGKGFGGLTVLADSRNFRAPWWHARDYGLLVANPFGRRAMTRGEKSRIVVEPGKRLELRFGVLVRASSNESDVDLRRVFDDFDQARAIGK